MSVPNRLVVAGIPRQPLPYGLFSVLTPRSTTDPHWQHGVVWEALGCEPASGIGDQNCDPEEESTGLPKVFNEGGLLGEAEAFTVYGSYKCSPVGHSVDYAQGRANEKLLAREEARVEQAIWTGDLDNEGFAADAEDAGGTATSLTAAIAALEQWLAVNYGSLGTIHMTREAAAIAVAELVLVTRNNTLYTVLGTPVVAGAGYPGTGPEDQAPAAGQTYLYATPALMGYRSEIFTSSNREGDLLDRSVNDLYAVAERQYLVGWDPCGTAFAIADLGD